MVRSRSTGIPRPPVPGSRSLSDRGGAVLGYGRNQWFTAMRLVESTPFPPSRPVKCARTKTLFELFFIDAHSSGDPNHAIGRDFALSNPEINRISRDSESLGDFAYFGKLRRHRHDLVISSNQEIV